MFLAVKLTHWGPVMHIYTSLTRLSFVQIIAFREVIIWSWWRHQMETFSALLAICARNSPVPGEFPTQRPVTRSFDVFFDLRLNKRLSKQSRDWWFETPAWSLWRHRNVMLTYCWLDHWQWLSVSLNQNAIVLIQENAFENNVGRSDDHFVSASTTYETGSE